MPGLPTMPAGWKPGDPIPLPDLAALQQAGGTAGAAAPAAPEPVKEAPTAAAAPARPLLQRPVFDASFLMLDNNDLEEADEEFSSSEEDSEE